MTHSTPIPICVPIVMDGTPLSVTVRKLMNNDGHGGRSQTPAVLQCIKPAHESQWQLDTHTKIHDTIGCASTGVIVQDCSTQEPLPMSQKLPPLPPKNIITTISL